MYIFKAEHRRRGRRGRAPNLTPATDQSVSTHIYPHTDTPDNHVGSNHIQATP